MPKKEPLSLISLDFSSHSSLFDEHLKWWLTCSLFLHLIFLASMMNLRLPTSIAPPIDSLQVALIALSELTPTQNPLVDSEAQSVLRRSEYQQPKLTPQTTTSQAQRLSQLKPVNPALNPASQPTPEENLTQSFEMALKAIIVPKQRDRKAPETTELKSELPPTPRVGLQGITLPPKAPKLAPVDLLSKNKPAAPDTTTRQAQPSEKMKKSMALETIKLFSSVPPPSTEKLFAKRKDLEAQSFQKSEKLEKPLDQVIQSVKVPRRPTLNMGKSPVIEKLISAPKAPPLTSIKSEGLVESRSLAGLPKKHKQKQPAQSPTTLRRVPSSPKASQLAPVELNSAKLTRTKEIDELDLIFGEEGIEDEMGLSFEDKDPNREIHPGSLASQIAMLPIPKVSHLEFDQALTMQEQDRNAKTDAGGQFSVRSSDRDPYWAAVEARIDREWVASRVEVKGDQLFPTVFTFRLERSGQITRLALEKSSGNIYFDEAAKRAILSANPLQPFPSQITQEYRDLRYKFTLSKNSP